MLQCLMTVERYPGIWYAAVIPMPQEFRCASLEQEQIWKARQERWADVGFGRAQLRVFRGGVEEKR